MNLSCIFLINKTPSYLTDNGSTNIYVKLVFTMIAFIIVLVLAYLSSKWIANYKGSVNNYGNIKIIESVFIAHQNRIMLLKVGEKYILVGVTKDKISYISEVSADEIKTNPQKFVQIPFENILKKLSNKIDDDLKD